MSVSSLSSLSSLSDDSDDELAALAVRARRPRRFLERKNPFDVDDEDFKSKYRINKNTFNQILDMIRINLEPPTQRNRAISAKLQLLVALRFLATGSFQQALADNVGIHKSSASRIIAKVIYQLALLKPHYVYMPRNEQERNEIKTSFHNIKGFPKVIGAIDCTHVKIRSPGGKNAERFRNRKGYFSINVQMVCDAKLSIRNVIARWPGSVHDSTIFKDSPLCAKLSAGYFGTDYILGDNDYPCETYLLTPLLNPTKPAERAYNSAHMSTRNCIERCFGVLKRRFPCLSKGLEIKLQTTLHVIIACVVLHNICILQNDEFDDDNIFEEMVDEEPVVNIVNNNENTAVRSALINSVFAIN